MELLCRRRESLGTTLIRVYVQRVVLFLYRIIKEVLGIFVEFLLTEISYSPSCC